MSTDSQSTGSVYLVGAGPGDPGLITLRGVQCIAIADVILYDYLVNPHILRHAHKDAELLCLGKHGKTRVWSQDEINQTMVDLAIQGKSVVRLKGGDPSVFAHGAEEATVLAEADISFEIVPGITAALAAAGYAGTALTHRDLASAVALITGHENPEKQDSLLDYEALARFPGTLVFYMGVTTSEQWVTKLIANGRPANTPAMVIRRISCHDQQTIRCTLEEVPVRLAGPPAIRPPVLTIIGDVAQAPQMLAWFESRPLFGQTILVTRSESQSKDLIDQFEQLGAQVLSQPAIEICEPDSWADVDSAISNIGTYDWLVFSSSNGVRHFFKRLSELGLDTRSLAGNKVAAIGQGTARTLGEFNITADLIPVEYRAESLVESLKPHAEQGESFLLLRANRGREVLSEGLVSAGGAVDQVVVYNSNDTQSLLPEIEQKLASGEVTLVTVTSSAIARSVMNLLGPHAGNVQFASISPITSETLRGLGKSPEIEASEYTMDGLVRAICENK